MHLRALTSGLLLAALTTPGVLASLSGPAAPGRIGQPGRVRITARAARLDLEHELDSAWTAAHPTLDVSSAVVSGGKESGAAGLPVVPFRAVAPSRLPEPAAAIEITTAGLLDRPLPLVRGPPAA